MPCWVEFSACDRRTRRFRLSVGTVEYEQLTPRSDGKFRARDKRTSHRIVQAQVAWNEHCPRRAQGANAGRNKRRLVAKTQFGALLLIRQ